MARHHPATRQVGLVRLRTVTTGITVLSAAGTVAFGALAALWFRGNASATSSDPTVPGRRPDDAGNDPGSDRHPGA